MPSRRNTSAGAPTAQRPQHRHPGRKPFGLCESPPTPSGARLQTGLVSEKESPAICSAKACRASATWAVVWNNPRLHTPDREKVWVACGEHKQPLADYLAVRSFLKRVEPLGRSS
jgi:hypothetical protein